MTRRTLLPILLTFSLLAVIAGIWSSFIEHRSNLISRNPSWRVMKQAVVYHPSAYRNFLNQPIDAQGVNLWLGQGYQGIEWHKPPEAAISDVAVRAVLDVPGSYLFLLFRVQDQGAYGLLVSTNAKKPSGFYSFSRAWKILRFQPLELPEVPAAGEPFLLRLRLRGDRYSAWLNDRSLTSFQDRRLRGGTFGLKGGFLPVHVRRVEVQGRAGDGSGFAWSDDFRHGDRLGWMWPLILVGAFLLLLAGLGALARAWGAADQRIRVLPRLVLLLSLSLLALVPQLWADQVYPGLVGLLMLTLGGAFLVSELGRNPQSKQGGRSSGRLSRWAALGLFATVMALAFAQSAFPRPDESSALGQWARRLESPQVRVGKPIHFQGPSLGEQVLQGRFSLSPGSLMEIRIWGPDDNETSEYRCHERWHSLLLSTVPEVESGFYLYDTKITLLQGISPIPAEGEFQLKLEARGGTLSAYRDGHRLARVESLPESGASGIFLFAGSARIADLDVQGTPRQRSSEPVRSDILPLLVALSGAGLLLLVGKGFKRSLVLAAVSLLFLLFFTGFARALALSFELSREELMFFSWAGFWGQALILLDAISESWLTWSPAVRRVALVGLTGTSVFYPAFGHWGGPFQVVQLQLKAELPPTPFEWLWYRHPSFRACNRFVSSQNLGGRPFPTTAPGDRVRVVCMGASQTLGFGASSLDQSYPRHLERMLNQRGERFEVINAGVPGSYTLTAASYLQGVLTDLKPDAIILNFCAADYMYHSLLHLQGIDADQAIRRIETRGFSQNPLQRLWSNFEGWKGLRDFQQGQLPEVSVLAALYQESLEELVQAAQQTGAEVFVMLEPKTSEVSHPIIDYPRLYPYAREVAQRRGAHVIDPVRAMSHAEQSGIVWWDYAHMTDFGYQELAREVGRSLQLRLRTKEQRQPLPSAASRGTPRTQSAPDGAQRVGDEQSGKGSEFQPGGGGASDH